MNENPQEALRDALWGRDLACVAAHAGKVDLSATDMHGWTPLHIAAHTGFLDAVMLLLASGADPTLREVHGCTPAQLAEERDHRTVALLLRRAENVRHQSPSFKGSLPCEKKPPRFGG